MTQPTTQEEINNFNVETSMTERFTPRFVSLIGLLAVIVCGALLFYLGRISVQIKTVKPIPTPTTIVSILSPTVHALPTTPKTNITCFPPPDCSDVIPSNCVRSAPSIDANGCMKSCGQLQCESLQTLPTATPCNTDSDCPKSASCVPGDSCYLYYCVNHSCILKAVQN